MRLKSYVFTSHIVFSRKDHEKAEFEVHEVYAVDVLISTGEGKVRVLYLFFLFIYFHTDSVLAHQLRSVNMW